MVSHLEGMWQNKRPFLDSFPLVCFPRLCGFEPFFDPRGDQYMYSRILNCDYEFVSPWWDEVSLNAKDLVSYTNDLTLLFMLNVKKCRTSHFISKLSDMF